MERYDVVIIGSGVGGGATALKLARTGASILILERGDYLPAEEENWDVEAVFLRNRYWTREELWRFDRGAPERPAAYYYVGGASKFYAAIMARLRAEDFGPLTFEDGVSPAWPISYDDLEPYYCEAERLFDVHGAVGDDPTEPPHSAPPPFAPVGHEPTVQRLVDGLKARGLKPYDLPIAVDLGNGDCARCATCDGFPCKIRAKGDAETKLIRPALAHGNVALRTGSTVERLIASKDGARIEAVEYRETGAGRNGALRRVSGRTVVLAAGAVNSAALLLRSADETHPNGLANTSDTVGRHYMAHNSSIIMGVGVSPTRTVFQKTFGLSDYYFGDRDYPYPMGNVQMVGKVQGPMIATRAPYLPAPLRDAIARRSIDWYAQSEDLPHPDSRVTIGGDGGVRLDRKRTNRRPHAELIKRTARLMRGLGYPLVFSKELGSKVTSHQCGTVRFGADPRSAALDPFCRAFDHPNLFVVDGSFFPSSGAMNPTLTIAAQALRVAEHIAERDLEPS